MEFLTWNPDPVLLAFGSFKIHWYGALFAVAIMSGLHLMKWMYTREGKDTESLDTGFYYVVIGVIVGARLAHCLFYEPSFYLANPLKILAVWEGGLASHGGGLGAIIGTYLYSKKFNINTLWLMDRLAIITVSFGFFVRIANFINSEIIGMPSQVSWAVIFEKVDMLPRHPAQLYEAFSYLAIFAILFLLYLNKKTHDHKGMLLGSFLVLVFAARIAVEFVKVKQAAYDTELAFNTGQLLSLPFLVVGLGIMFWSFKQQNKSTSA